MTSKQSVEQRNMFIVKNITAEQVSLLTTLNVSESFDIKVNLLDLSVQLKDNGLYNMYVSVGNTNDPVLTEIMEKKFRENMLLLNLSYQIKKSIVIGAFNLIITNIPGIWRRFLTQVYENNIVLELFMNSVGTKNDPGEQTVILLCENPFDVERLFNLIFTTDYAVFDKISNINKDSVLCLTKNTYNK